MDSPLHKLTMKNAFLVAGVWRHVHIRRFLSNNCELVDFHKNTALESYFFYENNQGEMRSIYVKMNL